MSIENPTLPRKLVSIYMQQEVYHPYKSNLYHEKLKKEGFHYM